ncbi:Extracellular signal-regulated kinase 1 [Diplonema papillatum]|nr:Extracellular signal-regulated kinase 1 [Diplonema papillatum]
MTDTQPAGLRCMAVKRYMVQFEKPGAMKGAVYKECFELPLRYTVDETMMGLGVGAFGAVVEATDHVLNKKVAIKKWKDVFDPTQPFRTKSTLRELKLLRHFSTKTHCESKSHPNILCAKEILIPLGNPEDSPKSYLERKKEAQDVYVVLEKYTMSLKQLMATNTPLPESLRAYFMFQLLTGLKAIFSASCLHRDLKPENMLIQTADSGLCICDLGSGREFDGSKDCDMTDLSHTTTQWYRPPESFLQGIQRSVASAVPAKMRVQNAQTVDIWSCGVIMAEMMSGGKPLLAGKGNDIISQLTVIFTTIAPIPPEHVESFDGELKTILTNISKAGQSASLRKRYEGKLDPTGEVFSEEEIDILERMLKIDPDERISIDDALNHDYITQYEFEQPILEVEPFTCRIDDDMDMREAIWQEYMDCTPEVREFFARLEAEEAEAEASKRATAEAS